MPYASDNQRKAMHAAASGNSTIGIPQSVGKKYASHGGGASHQTALRSGGGKKYGGSNAGGASMGGGT